MSKITILFGAGAEGEGQFGLPSGNRFKRDIILAKGSADFANLFLNNSSVIKVKKGATIAHNSTSILYQTIVEACEKDEFALETLFPNVEERNIIEEYVENKRGRISLNYDSKEIAKKKFTEAYNKFYTQIKEKDVSEFNDSVRYFLENAGIYSFLDSLFNYLRKPEEYPNECARVIKIYYAALLSILNCMSEKLEADNIDEVKKYQRIKECNLNRKDAIIDLANIIEQFQNVFIERSNSYSEEKKRSLYYYQIKELFNLHRHEISCVTTNYTEIAQKIIGIPDDKIAYLHGKLNLFEDLKTKKIFDINSEQFNHNENIIFPYLLVQSGVKPIISSRQIHEFSKACDMIENDDEVLVIGYGLNPDDEHIINFLRRRLEKGKTVKIFIHCDSRDSVEWYKKIELTEKLLENKEMIEYYHSTEFYKIINGL